MFDFYLHPELGFSLLCLLILSVGLALWVAIRDPELREPLCLVVFAVGVMLTVHAHIQCNS